MQLAIQFHKIRSCKRSHLDVENLAQSCMVWDGVALTKLVRRRKDEPLPQEGAPPTSFLLQ